MTHFLKNVFTFRKIGTFEGTKKAMYVGIKEKRSLSIIYQGLVKSFKKLIMAIALALN